MRLPKRMTRPSDPFDSYLLKVLCALVTERSVSRTAIKLNQSQPAISAALKRLRAVFKDPLLVREKNRMVPTQRAIELLGPARAALGEIEKLFVERERFDPASTQQSFKIASPDFLAVFFLASVVEQFRRDAPLAHLAVHALGPDFDYEQALARGELDIVIGNWPEPPEHLHLSTILEDEIVCVMSRDHPLAKNGLTVEQYSQAHHIVPIPYSVSHRPVVDTHLATLRLKRNARVMLSFFNMAPYLLPDTDLIFTTSHHFARYYAGFLPLAIVQSPIKFPRMRFYQLWHGRTHLSEGHRWLRSLIVAAGEKLQERKS
jgi:DNA-binding transcriptional LysR family regulator